jgi:PilZ domain
MGLGSTTTGIGRNAVQLFPVQGIFSTVRSETDSGVPDNRFSPNEFRIGALARVVHLRQEGGPMGERRKARRYEVYLPLQVCASRRRPAEFHTAQLRDVSRTGIYFHSDRPIEAGTKLELTFALPTEREAATSALVRASAEVLRLAALDHEVAPVYGIAATIERIDLVRPVASNAAA